MKNLTINAKNQIRMSTELDSSTDYESYLEYQTDMQNDINAKKELLSKLADFIGCDDLVGIIDPVYYLDQETNMISIWKDTDSSEEKLELSQEESEHWLEMFRYHTTEEVVNFNMTEIDIIPQKFEQALIEWGVLLPQKADCSVN